MSLLLDALKRAEQEKLARQPASTAAPASHVRAVPNSAAAAAFELQPIAPAPGSSTSQASASQASAAQAARAANISGVRVEPNPQAVHNAFQAKAEDPDSARNRTLLWAIFGAIALIAIAAAAYVWYSVKSFTPPQVGAPRPRAAPTPAPASGAALPPTAAMGSIVPAPGMSMPSSVTTEPPPAPVPPPASGLAPSNPATPTQIPTAAAPRETPGERLSRAAAETAPRAAPPLLDRASDPGRRVHGGVSTGYEALRQGDLAGARRGYEEALASDPTNVDAHLGMATLAARGADRSTAAQHYRRALDLDPRNATAIAGLAALADFSRPEGLEEQLRADISRQPESGALHFTLGNLYASQARWNEAQTAYFEAHRRDPGSADVAYNLAVALDHLGQRRLAANFYLRALEGARGRAAQFDSAAAARRLEELR